MESEFYKKEYLELEKKLNQLPNSVLSNISIKITDGTHFTPKYTEEGVTFLSALNVLENKVVLSAGHRYISMEEHRQLYGRCDPKAGDILLRKVGVGARFAAVVPSGLPEFSVFVSLALIRPAKNIYPRFLSTFINTKIGQSQLIRVQKGASQPDLHLEDIQTLVVPTLGDNFQRSVELIVSNADTIVKLSIEKYAEAELLLLTEIGFDGFVPSTDNINTKAYSESFLSSGRLDPEYYQPKYEQYEQAVLGCSLGHTLIQDEFMPVKEGTNLTKSEYKYIEIGDVNVGDGSCNYTIRMAEELPANAKYLVQKGDLLISKVRPNRGAVTIIPFDEPDLIVSGAFTVLRAKPKSVFSNETLKVLLRTNVYKDWLLKFNVGTQYPVIKDEDILNLPIPKISAERQLEISTKIKEAEVMRHKSESLLEIAKRAVEIAIEQDEAIAEKYIQDECLRLGVSLDMTKGTKY